MPRMSAEARREEIVEIAFRHFAAGGFAGTSTESIAREAGISQPYLFRLFKTKKELFKACGDRCFGMITRVFEEAAAAAEPGQVIEAMGEAYTDRLLADRTALMFQLQAYTAADPDIRRAVQVGFNGLRTTVARLAGVEEEQTWSFFADGMLLNVIAMLELDWQPPKE
jgi:AcrR family transcriptional regulator